MDGDNLEVNQNLETGDGQTQNPQEQLENNPEILDNQNKDIQWKEIYLTLVK